MVRVTALFHKSTQYPDKPMLIFLSAQGSPEFAPTVDSLNVRSAYASGKATFATLPFRIFG